PEGDAADHDQHEQGQAAEHDGHAELIVEDLEFRLDQQADLPDHEGQAPKQSADGDRADLIKEVVLVVGVRVIMCHAYSPARGRATARESGPYPRIIECCSPGLLGVSGWGISAGPRGSGRPGTR